MVRAPCCEKMGLKKGPWTRDEDQILVNFVTHHGHGNWRALPKQAGLLRCGKSCRLRWTNYLRPDIKRGNFSEEEEETIINLHQVLGNRWSAIAARLPGRTDNEIKNVWHTHLKKRIKKIQESTAPLSSKIQIFEFKNEDSNAEKSRSQNEEEIYQPNSPQQQSSITTATTTTATSVEDTSVSMNENVLADFLEVDDTFWSEIFSNENYSGATSDYLADNSGTATSEFNGDDFHLQFLQFDDNRIININDDDMESFWYDMVTNSSGQ